MTKEQERLRRVRIVALTQQGVSREAIAERLGMSRRSLTEICCGMGLLNGKRGVHHA